MPARPLPGMAAPPPKLGLFRGSDSKSDTRSGYPGVGAPGRDSIGGASGAKPDLASIYEAIRDGNELDQPEISPEDLTECRETWCLARFYETVVAPWRRRLLGRNGVKPGTLEKERQAVRCFDGWDQQQQPDRWPAGNIWRGLPTRYLAGRYFERWATDRMTGLAVATVESRWNALRTVINCAIRLGAMDQQLLPCLSPLFDKRREELALEGDYDEFVATTYTLDQLGAVYHALADVPDLQTAWVLGANAGPRTVDLFTLRWSVNVRLNADTPELFYAARKTGKKHWVPLPPCVVAHLRRHLATQRQLCPEPEGLVFPRLTAGASKDPEKSRAAHARNDRLKEALVACGMDANDEDSDYWKPVQVLRATCNTRANNHRAGKGLLITHGKDADVSSRHYWDERDALIEAVMTLPQPPAFLSLEV